MKRDAALALFEAHKHADVPEFLDGKMDFQEAAFLSGIAAGLREAIEQLEANTYRGSAHLLRASLNELEKP